MLASSCVSLVELLILPIGQIGSPGVWFFVPFGLIIETNKISCGYTRYRVSELSVAVHAGLFPNLPCLNLPFQGAEVDRIQFLSRLSTLCLRLFLVADSHALKLANRVVTLAGHKGRKAGGTF